MWRLLPRPLATHGAARTASLTAVSAYASRTACRASAKDAPGSAARHGPSCTPHLAALTPAAALAPVHSTVRATMPTEHAAAARVAARAAARPRRHHELPNHLQALHSVGRRQE